MKSWHPWLQGPFLNIANELKTYTQTVGAPVFTSGICSALKLLQHRIDNLILNTIQI